MSALPISSGETPMRSPVPLPPRPHAFPGRQALLDPRAPYLLPLLIVIVTRGVMSLLLPLASEDAYITYRYARNLALGLGPVFNPGERVMGFTSPLWMVWNSLGWLLTHDPVGWSRLWATFADMLTLVCGAHLIERHVSRTAAWCFAFAIAAWVSFTGVAISGMENGVLVALVFLSAALMESGSRAAGVALGALALTRPEGAIAAIVMLVRARARDRLVALGLMAIGYGLLTLYFGTPLPNSMLVKAQIYGTPGPWSGRHWWEWALPFALGRWPSMPDGRILFLATILFAPAAWEGARELWRIRGTPLAFAVAAFVVIWAGYVATGAAYFFWYMVAPLAAWFVLASMGLPRLVRGRAVYVSVALFVFGCWTVVWELYAGRARAEAFFKLAADHLAAHATPGDKVLLEPIGIVGYRAPVVILDEVGLVSPRIAHRRRQGPGWMSDVVAAEHPQWILARRGVLASLAAFAGAGDPFRSGEERDRMLREYRSVGVIDDAAGDAALILLQRNEGPAGQSPRPGPVPGAGTPSSGKPLR